MSNEVIKNKKMEKGRIIMRSKNDWCIQSMSIDENRPSNQIIISEICDDDIELLTSDYNGMEIKFEMVNGKAKLYLS